MDFAANGNHDGDLTLASIEAAFKKMRFLQPDRCEIRYLPLTAIGRYSQRFREIEDANRGPFGPLMPMVEDEYMPEGILIIRNLEKFPKEPPIQIVDLRTEEERSLPIPVKVKVKVEDTECS